jgi:hypothetical protein
MSAFQAGAARRISRRYERCDAALLTGSTALLPISRSKLALNGLNASELDTPSFGQACHQPCSPPPTRGSRWRAFERACLPTDFGFAIPRTDALFPPKIAPDVINALTAAGVEARYFELDSDLGHLMPLVANGSRSSISA